MIIPVEDAVKYLKEQINKTYGAKGQDIVDMNCAAVDKGITMVKKIEVPAEWANAVDAPVEENKEIPAFFKDVLFKMGRQEGNDLPVSASTVMKTVAGNQVYTVGKTWYRY